MNYEDMNLNVTIDDELEELIPNYLRNKRDQIIIMRDAYRHRDYDNLASVAHQLAGSAGGYGFDDLTRISLKLEDAALKKVEDSIIEEYINSIEKYVDNVNITYAPDIMSA